MNTLLYIQSLKKYYPILGGVLRRRIAEVRAVDGVSFEIKKGECFGLVGESGCGKTTLGKTILRLLKPDGGSIYFGTPPEILEQINSLEKSDDNSPKLKRLKTEYDIATFRGSKLRLLRRKMQIVYQDPTTSLDPRMLVKDIVAEPLVAQGICKGSEVKDRVVEMLEKVGLSENQLYRYPHEFSGGQRQRIAVARALVTRPEFVVLDEPTSSVDVSVRAQLLNLFQDLQKEFDLTYMFVSHDLSVVECISDRLAVMYLGKIVEIAETHKIFSNPLHPYTQALFSAIPRPDPTKRKERPPLSGEVPSPVNPPSGCRFHPRCRMAMDVCGKVEPSLIDVGDGHLVACHLMSKGV